MSARIKLIAGNWKMNGGAAFAGEILDELKANCSEKATAQMLICVPFTLISQVATAARHTHILTGAQDVFWLDSGAFTSSISGQMLREAGAKAAIIGHSETRGRFGKLDTPGETVPYFAESDLTVNLKIHAALRNGLMAIPCVGETLAEREAGNIEATIQAQLEGAFKDISADQAVDIVIAYEPVWAIGTGETCASDEAERICGFIRNWCASKWDSGTAEQMRILYGGSMKPDNAEELLGMPNIDGGLIGGASLDAGQFAKIWSFA